MLIKKNGQDIDAENIINSKIYQARRDIININLESKKNIDFVITNNNQVDVMPVGFFQGRVSQIKELKDLVLNGKKAILVHGMGGIGKTEICKTIYQDFLNRHHKGDKIEFEHIGFLRYENNIDETLVNSFQSYLTANLWEEKRDQAWEFLRKISNETSVLLIIDGVNQQISNDPNLKNLNTLSCWLILTSRNKLFKDFFSYEVKGLDYASCKNLFISIYDAYEEKEENNLEYIINELALGHTLTVKLFACLARDNVWSISELKKMLEEKHFKLSYLNDGQEEIMIEEYKKLFHLSGLNNKEINILEAFSILPYRMLPIDYCNNWMSSDVGMETIALTINSINQKGWLETSKREFAMHPVISETIRSTCMPSLKDHINLVEACANSIDNHIAEIQKQDLPLILFAESLVQYLYNESSITIGSLLAKGGNLLYCQANYEKSLEWNLKALDIFSNYLELDNPIIAVLEHRIGTIYLSQGNYKKGLEWFEKALEIRERVLGTDNLETADTYNNIAMVYQYSGDNTKALEYHKMVLAIRKKVLGMNNSITSSSFNNIAGVYLNQGDYKKALEYFNYALSICEKAVGEDHYHTATIYQNLGTVYQNLGDYDRSLSLHKKALVITEKEYGKKHPYTGTVYNNIGVVYKIKGNYELAIRWLRKSLVICEDILGFEHPDTASTYNNMGGIYQSQGNYTKAMECHRKALDISNKIFGEKHPITATTYHNIALVYQSIGDYKKAQELYEKVLVIKEKVFGTENVECIETYHNLAGIYYKQDNYKRSKDLIMRSYQIALKEFGVDHAKTKFEREHLEKVQLTMDKNK